MGNFLGSLIFLVLFFSIQAFSQNQQALMSKAAELHFQKNRSFALKLLLRSPNLIMTSKIGQLFQEIATDFYEEETQKLYEQGLLIKKNDLALALVKIQEGIRREPDNLSLILENSRLRLMLGQCSNGSEELRKLRDLYEIDPQFKLAKAQLKVCQKEPIIFETKGPYLLYWKMLEAEQLLQAKQTRKAKDLFLQVQSLDPDFPESWWGLSRAEIDLKEKRSVAPERYLQLCRGINSRIQQKYAAYPFLCRRMAEVEVENRKMSGGSP